MAGVVTQLSSASEADVQAMAHYLSTINNSSPAERLKNIPGITLVKRVISKGSEDGIFPDFGDGKPSTTREWNKDNMGPIYIPEAGKTVSLNRENLPFYNKIISSCQHKTKI